MRKLIEKSVYAVALLLTLFTVSAANAATIVLGYCDDEIKDTDYKTELTMQETTPIQAAIRFTSAQLSAYEGAKITKIRFGSQAGMTQTYAWIRPSKTDPVVAIKRLGTTVDGWNEVTLDEPYVITGSEIYVGYNGTMPAGNILPMNGASNTNGAFLWFDNEWMDASSYGFGSLVIQAVVETDGQETSNDLSVEDLKMDSKFAKAGDTRSFTVTVGNYGTQDAKLPVIHYQVGDTSEQQYTDDKTIRPGGNMTVNLNATIGNLPEGKNTVKVWIDSDDEDKDNNTVTGDLYAYTSSYPRRTLLEQFTTIQCTNCPMGNKTLAYVLQDKDNVSWVAHHVGYYTDELTVDASKDVMVFGVKSAPLAMFDRTVTPFSQIDSYGNSQPLFVISYNTIANGAKYVNLAYLCTSIQPSFVSVNIKSAYDEASRKVTVTVSGEKNDALFKLLYDKTALTVYLTEDNVKANVAQVGGEPDDYYHNHVLRKAITASLGDGLTWNGDTYTATYETTIDENWKPADMKVVAFVSRAYDNNAAQAEVINTAEVKLDGTSAISGVEDNAAAGATTYYTLDGQKVTASQLIPNTVYVQRSVSANGTAVVRKVTVK